MAGSQNVDNYLSNAQFMLVPYEDSEISSDYGAMVHKGFYEVWQSITDEVMGIVADMVDEYSDTSIIRITGHSMGAAVTGIISMNVKYTYGDMNVIHHAFGSPRWGNSVLAMHFDDTVDQSWRVVQHRDVVPALPPIFLGYHHVGVEIWFVCVYLAIFNQKYRD